MNGIILTALAVISILTTLTVEALKKILGNIKYSANVLAAIVAVVLSVAVSAGYMIYTSGTWTPQVVVTVVALAFLSFLGATVGWDKVVQAIEQIKRCE